MSCMMQSLMINVLLYKVNISITILRLANSSIYESIVVLF